MDSIYNLDRAKRQLTVKGRKRDTLLNVKYSSSMKVMASVQLYGCSQWRTRQY
ncbi:MAG: hypothetical protein IJX65_08380 [Alistipes sp.]|nr:hypothetical protein [Alistipes sp.]